MQTTFKLILGCKGFRHDADVHPSPKKFEKEVCAEKVYEINLSEFMIYFDLLW